MNCLKCNMPMKLVHLVFDKEKGIWIDVIPFWQCGVCKEEYYEEDL